MGFGSGFGDFYPSQECSNRGVFEYPVEVTDTNGTIRGMADNDIEDIVGLYEELNLPAHEPAPENLAARRAGRRETLIMKSNVFGISVATRPGLWGYLDALLMYLGCIFWLGWLCNGSKAKALRRILEDVVRAGVQGAPTADGEGQRRFRLSARQQLGILGLYTYSHGVLEERAPLMKRGCMGFCVSILASTIKFVVAVLLAVVVIAPFKNPFIS